MKIELYHGDGSNCCQRIKWALAYKNIPYSAIDCTDMASEDYSQINPFLTAPTLVVDGQVVLESFAQAELLEELGLGSPPLLPQDVWMKSRVKQICLVMAASLHPLQTNKAARLALPGGSPDELKQYRANVIHQGLLKIERFLFTESAFCVGDGFSLADIFVVPLYLKSVNLNPKLVLPKFEMLIEACRNEPRILGSSPRDMIGLR